MAKKSDQAERSVIGDVARWVKEFDYDGIPDSVIGLAKMSLFDCLGGAFAATKYSEPAAKALEALDDFGRSTACTVIGEKRRASVVNAVFANGLLIRALDFNDHLEFDPNDNVKLGSHPSDQMAVGLSVGEWRGASGRDVLGAMVMGYELNGRLQKLFGHDSNWDHTTATGLMAPAIASRLMGLDEEKTGHALGFGMAHGVTPGSVRRGAISAGKFLADPIVAQTGVMGTLLAARGVTGPTAVFDGSRGLALALFPKADLSALTKPVGKHYLFEGVCIKAYPCFANSQAAVSAALEVRGKMGLSADAIERIDITMADVPSVTSQLAEKARRYPDSQETADHSFHFLVAVALIDGEVTFKSFENERWHDPKVTGLMDRIVITPDRRWNERVPGGAPAGLTVTAKDGRRGSAEVSHAKGHILNPFDLPGLRAKFNSCTESILGPERQKAIADTALALDKEPSLKKLMGLLAG